MFRFLLFVTCFALICDETTAQWWWPFFWAVDGPKFKTGYHFDTGLKAFFKFHQMPATWLEARRTCLMEGAILSTALTWPYNTLLRQILKAKKNVWIHTGSRGIMGKKIFMSMEGISVWNMSFNWRDSEPNSRGSQDCIMMNSDGLFGDGSCSLYLPFVCYRKKKKEAFFPCGTVDIAYLADTESTSCYKVHTKPQTWKEALRICYAEAAHLAIINNPRESNLMKYLMALYPPYKIKGPYYKGSYLMGFHNLFGHYGWVTLKGDTLEEAGYDTWAPNQPSNDAPGEYCGSVFRNGLLNDASCDYPLPFICEKLVEGTKTLPEP